MVKAKTHCYGWRQKTKTRLGRNRGIPKNPKGFSLGLVIVWSERSASTACCRCCGTKWTDYFWDYLSFFLFSATYFSPRRKERILGRKIFAPLPPPWSFLEVDIWSSFLEVKILGDSTIATEWIKLETFTYPTSASVDGGRSRPLSLYFWCNWKQNGPALCIPLCGIFFYWNLNI